MKTQTEAKRIFWVVVVVLTFFFVVIGAVVGYVNYSYQLDKCSNMHTSPYNFNIDLQVNADYAQECYFITNHPLAQVSHIFLGMFLVLLLMTFVLIIPALVIYSKIEDLPYTDSDTGESYY